MSVLAVGAGAGGVTALVVAPDGSVTAHEHQVVAGSTARPGTAGLLPERLWQAVLAAVRGAVAAHGRADLRALGVTARGDAVVVWDRETLASPGPAAAGRDGLARLAEDDPRTWAWVLDGRCAVGTLDSYLLARMTRGTWHLTDASQAARTGLLDLGTGDWSPEACASLGVPRDALPELVATWGEAATTEPRVLGGLSLPVAGLAADRSAALLGQAGLDPGDAACGYDDPPTVLVQTGQELVRDAPGLAPTVAWRGPDGTTTYAVEGAVRPPAAPGPDDGEALAAAVGDLLAPVRGTTSLLRVDGAAAADDRLCQRQADLTGLPVVRSGTEPAAAYGAALLAGLGVGAWSGADELRAIAGTGRRFEPRA